MNLQEFIKTIAQYVGDYLSKRFTGKIVLTVNIRDGGIANVNVQVEHQLQKNLTS